MAIKDLNDIGKNITDSSKWQSALSLVSKSQPTINIGNVKIDGMRKITEGKEIDPGLPTTYGGDKGEGE